MLNNLYHIPINNHIMTKNVHPKYMSISKEIIKRIESGELQAGDKVQSENELIKTYKISNTTARKSLLEVELKGWATTLTSYESNLTIIFSPGEAIPQTGMATSRCNTILSENIFAGRTSASKVPYKKKEKNRIR